MVVNTFCKKYHVRGKYATDKSLQQYVDGEQRKFVLVVCQRCQKVVYCISVNVHAVSTIDKGDM